MPEITDPPPRAVVNELAGLRAALDRDIPPRRLDHNLLVATWNIRAFGGLTEKWEATGDDSPKRDLRSLLAIAEIVSRFDVVALQEVRGNLKALRHMLKSLGEHWGLVLTDVTRGAAGNDERMAFLFDTRRIRMSGLACEVVLPPEWNGVDIGPDAALRQFARSPYAVSFLAPGRGYRRTFILVTAHIIYGDKPADRLGEMRAIAEWAASWANDVHAYDQSIMLLGDFNIDRKGDPNFDAFVSTGLRVPPELDEVPRTLAGTGKKAKFYDQIAWFTGEGEAPALGLTYSGQAGIFDFVGVLRPDLDTSDLSWRISDHYPLWVEFLTASHQG